VEEENRGGGANPNLSGKRGIKRLLKWIGVCLSVSMPCIVNVADGCAEYNTADNVALCARRQA